MTKIHLCLGTRLQLNCARGAYGETACWAHRSAHGFLHERPDLGLFCVRQFYQREGGRPHGAFVEFRLVQGDSRGDKGTDTHLIWK